VISLTRYSPSGHLVPRSHQRKTRDTLIMYGETRKATERSNALSDVAADVRAVVTSLDSLHLGAAFLAGPYTASADTARATRDHQSNLFLCALANRNVATVRL
jgi:hypothetical protein